jgi:DUF4097 and DUF4098 domain-containing protein YvlB
MHKALPISNAEPVFLSLNVKHGDVDILYSRDGQVTITAVAQASGDLQLDDAYFPMTVVIEQSRNHLTLSQVSNKAYPEKKIKVRLRIDVPYRTEVRSKVGEGNQTIRGILGPVEANSEKGDISVSYVSRALTATAVNGNVEAQVIGEHVTAKVATGNIYGERLAQGITSDAEDGDIKLMVVGPSTATVEKGSGRIDVGGARGSLTLRTDAGNLHVEAVPHDDWKLDSASGTIRLELPPVVNAQLSASTDSGDLRFERNDVSNAADILHPAQQPDVGMRIAIHTVSGRIVIR